MCLCVTRRKVPQLILSTPMSYFARTKRVEHQTVSKPLPCMTKKSFRDKKTRLGYFSLSVHGNPFDLAYFSTFRAFSVGLAKDDESALAPNLRLWKRAVILPFAKRSKSP